MQQSKYEKMPQGYSLEKLSPHRWCWVDGSGRMGFENWDRNLVIYSACKDSESSRPLEK